MKREIILASAIGLGMLFSALGPRPVLAIEIPAKEKAAQTMQILKQNLAVLRMIYANLNSVAPIKSKAYIAVDLESGKTLLSKNSLQALPIASITKLMGAVVALENIDLEKEITISEAMLKPYGASAAIFSDAKIKAKDLLKASLIQSSNDAMEALAASFGKQKFLALMNQKAKELKMAGTVYYDVHGLNPKNKSTPADLVGLLGYIQKKHPEILAITKENDFWLNDKNGKAVKFWNMNYLYPLADFLGGKTGYLVESRQTLTAIFEKNKKPVAIAVLYSNNAQADAFRILEKIKN